MMNQVTINIEETFKKMFPKILIKDLQDDERICPTCHGLGMRLENNIYGIHGDTSEAAKFTKDKITNVELMGVGITK